MSKLGVGCVLAGSVICACSLTSVELGPLASVGDDWREGVTPALAARFDSAQEVAAGPADSDLLSPPEGAVWPANMGVLGARWAAMRAPMKGPAGDLALPCALEISAGTERTRAFATDGAFHVPGERVRALIANTHAQQLTLTLRCALDAEVTRVQRAAPVHLAIGPDVGEGALFVWDRGTISAQLTPSLAAASADAIALANPDGFASSRVCGAAISATDSLSPLLGSHAGQPAVSSIDPRADIALSQDATLLAVALDGSLSVFDSVTGALTAGISAPKGAAFLSPVFAADATAVFVALAPLEAMPMKPSADVRGLARVNLSAVPTLTMLDVALEPDAQPLPAFATATGLTYTLVKGKADAPKEGQLMRFDFAQNSSIPLLAMAAEKAVDSAPTLLPSAQEDVEYVLFSSTRSLTGEPPDVARSSLFLVQCATAGACVDAPLWWPPAQADSAPSRAVFCEQPR